MPGVKTATNRRVAQAKKMRRRNGTTSGSASIASATRKKDHGGGRRNARTEAAPGAAGCAGTLAAALRRLTPLLSRLDTGESAIESNWAAKNAGSPKSSATSASSWSPGTFRISSILKSATLSASFCLCFEATARRLLLLMPDLFEAPPHLGTFGLIVFLGKSAQCPELLSLCALQHCHENLLGDWIVVEQSKHFLRVDPGGGGVIYVANFVDAHGVVVAFRRPIRRDASHDASQEHHYGQVPRPRSFACKNAGKGFLNQVFVAKARFPDICLCDLDQQRLLLGAQIPDCLRHFSWGVGLSRSWGVRLR